MTQPEPPPQGQPQTTAPNAAQDPAAHQPQPTSGDVAVNKTAYIAEMVATKPKQPISDHSIASLVLGIVSWLVAPIGFIPAIIAVVQGRKTRREFDTAFAAGNLPVNSKTGKPTNRSLATAGLVLGIITLVVYAIFIVLFIVLVIWAIVTVEPDNL